MPNPVVIEAAPSPIITTAKTFTIGLPRFTLPRAPNIFRRLCAGGVPLRGVADEVAEEGEEVEEDEDEKAGISSIVHSERIRKSKIRIEIIA
jgi:hypothetical protein